MTLHSVGGQVEAGLGSDAVRAMVVPIPPGRPEPTCISWCNNRQQVTPPIRFTVARQYHQWKLSANLKGTALISKHQSCPVTCVHVCICWIWNNPDLVYIRKSSLFWFFFYYTGYGDTAPSHLSSRLNPVLLASTFHVFKPVSKVKRVENNPFFLQRVKHVWWMSASGLLQTKLLSANHVIILFTWFLDHCNILFGML